MAGIKHRYARRHRRYRKGNESGVRGKAHRGCADNAGRGLSRTRRRRSRDPGASEPHVQRSQVLQRHARAPEIRLSEAAKSCKLDVRDNGAGINPTDHKIIFDKFSQAGATSSRRSRTAAGWGCTSAARSLSTGVAGCGSKAGSVMEPASHLRCRPQSTAAARGSGEQENTRGR